MLLSCIVNTELFFSSGHILVLTVNLFLFLFSFLLPSNDDYFHLSCAYFCCFPIFLSERKHALDIFCAWFISLNMIELCISNDRT